MLSIALNDLIPVDSIIPHLQAVVRPLTVRNRLKLSMIPHVEPKTIVLLPHDF